MFHDIEQRLPRPVGRRPRVQPRRRRQRPTPEFARHDSHGRSLDRRAGRCNAAASGGGEVMIRIGAANGFLAPVTPEQAVPTPAPQETVPEETAKVDAAPEAPAQKAPFTLEVKVKPDRTSWIVIEVDGSRAYAGMLGSDQAKTFEVTDEASVEVGKPQFVNITRDGEDVAIPIKKGIGLLELKAEVPKQ